MKFTKMHGLGNDFVVMQRKTVMPDVKDWAVTLCDRHKGVGADGLVLILPTPEADLEMRIFNADGSEAEQCGNAIRCVAKYAVEKMGLMKEEMQVKTKRGIQTLRVMMQQRKVQNVQVDMGEPILQASQIPVVSLNEQVIQERIELPERIFTYTAVSMGNPHIVIEVDDLSSFSVETYGPLLETHPIFPRKTNVEFIQVHSPTEISMRVWERGVGETMACGSGACAVLVASVLAGKAQRKATIHLLGGDLEIEWQESNNHVFMTGPATFVFDGEWINA